MHEEFELTYLVKYFPEDFKKEHESKEILDIYIPKNSEHAILRIRKCGDRYEITKKTPAHGVDSSHQIENTIPLSKEEFADLARLEGKRVQKIRHYYEEKGVVYEIDIFQDGLLGLVLVDVEFKNNEEKSHFLAPDWFLSDVTEEKCIAGGVLCGKTYAAIEEQLRVFNYKRVAS